MTDSNDDQPTPGHPEEPAKNDSMRETREAFCELGDSVKKAFQAGAHDARKAAKDAVPQARKEFAKGLHDIAYGAAYLVSFGSALAREITPEPVCDGFSEGTDAGRKAAEDLMEKRRRDAEPTAGGDVETDSTDAVPA